MKWRAFALAACMAGGVDAADPAYAPPRTSFGDPDLQGLWTNASLTSLERPATLGKPVVTPDEAAAIERAAQVRMANDGRAGTPGPTSAPATAPFRGYNTCWTDPGVKLGVVRGEIRSSWIVDPPNGRIPYSSEGLRAMRAAVSVRSMDGPENRPLGERCILGFGSTSGPPMLNVLYNNHRDRSHRATWYRWYKPRRASCASAAPTRRRREGGGRPIGRCRARWRRDDQLPSEQALSRAAPMLYLPPEARVTSGSPVSPRRSSESVEDARAYTQAWRGDS